MRYQNTSHWSTIKSLEGLLYFSQLVDEMLFDYTLDSYKPLALNSRLLCIECLETIDEINNGSMVERNLQSVLEELKWNLENDYAAREILGIKINHYINLIKPNDIKLKQLQILIQFLYNAFQGRKYYEQIVTSLTETIKDGKNKSKIRTLTGSLLTELVNYGYNPTHVFYQNSNFFFNPVKRPKISSVDDIKDFFDFFDFEKREFIVVFIGGIIFRNFQGTLKDFDIVVSKSYKCFSKIPDDISFQASRKVNESFVICSKVESLDHHSARQLCESLLGQIAGLFNFYHHKERPEILDKTVICRVNDNYVVVSDKPIKPILKTKHDESPQEAAKSVESILTKLPFRSESVQRFGRVIDLHGAAISASALENQLLDLWAALETLIPKSMESNKDRIVQICDNLVPFLQLNYKKKQLIDILKDLKFWNINLINEILSNLPGTEKCTEIEKTACLIALNSNLPYRQKLYEELTDFPLLKNRLYMLHESMCNANAIKKSLDRHSIKANWHVRRIYRTRGLIIHSGKYPSYTSILIENLHNYFDLLLKKIMEVSIAKNLQSIDQALLEIRVTVEYQMKLLQKHKDEEITTDNIFEVLLAKE